MNPNVNDFDHQMDSIINLIPQEVVSEDEDYDYAELEVLTQKPQVPSLQTELQAVSPFPNPMNSSLSNPTIPKPQTYEIEQPTTSKMALANQTSSDVIPITNSFSSMQINNEIGLPPKPSFPSSNEMMTSYSETPMVDVVQFDSPLQPFGTKSKPVRKQKDPSLVVSYPKGVGIPQNMGTLITFFKLQQTEVGSLQFQMTNYEHFFKVFKTPSWLTISKKRLSSSFSNPIVVIVDSDRSERMVRSQFQSQTNDLIVLTLNPYNAFWKLFFELQKPVIPFTVLQSIIVFFLISNKIIVYTNYKMCSHLMKQLLSSLNLIKKVIFCSPPMDLTNLNYVEINQKREEIINLQLQPVSWVTFLAKNQLPSSYEEEVILEMFRLVNFNIRMQNEAFDGFSKTLFKQIKEQDLKSFSYNQLSTYFYEDHPLIPEKDLFKHFQYVIDNFNQDAPLPFFEFDDLPLTQRSVIKCNKTMIDKLFKNVVIIKKVIGDFWTGLIPIQLFLRRDYYALHLKNLISELISTNFSRVMQDGNYKYYQYLTLPGVINTGLSFQIYLSGLYGNVLEFPLPIKTREELLTELRDDEIPFTLNGSQIVFTDPKHATKYAKISYDKEKTFFDFKMVYIIGQEISRGDVYQELLKYFSDHIIFNLKLIKNYLIQFLIQKRCAPNSKEEGYLLDLFNSINNVSSTLNQLNYPSTYNIEESNKIFETTFFDSFNEPIDETLTNEKLTEFIKKRASETLNEFLL